MLDAIDKHRLAAILCADVVGYSRLMAADEEATVAALGELRSLVARSVPEHRGRLVDFTGDNFLAEFPSALAAVHCALALRDAVAESHADLPPERRMQLRMGMHLGEVRAEGERIYGDGVNIAARLEALAKPGGLCLSSAIRDQVATRLELDFEDLGERTLKNIPAPVRAWQLRHGGGQRPAQAAAVSLGRRLAWPVLVLVLLGALIVLEGPIHCGIPK